MNGSGSGRRRPRGAAFRSERNGSRRGPGRQGGALRGAARRAAVHSALAVAMGVQESEVRRMLDPCHATKIGRLEEALARFKKRLVITVEAAA